MSKTNIENSLSKKIVATGIQKLRKIVVPSSVDKKIIEGFETRLLELGNDLSSDGARILARSLSINSANPNSVISVELVGRSENRYKVVLEKPDSERIDQYFNI